MNYGHSPRGWPGGTTIAATGVSLSSVTTRSPRPTSRRTSSSHDGGARKTKNASGIVSCLRAARENARAVRGTLTTEVWETQNQTWLEFNRTLRTGTADRWTNMNWFAEAALDLLVEALEKARAGQ